MNGKIILVILKRGDEEIGGLYPELKHARGDEVLKDWVNTMFRTAVEKGMVGLPKPFHEWTAEEMAGWSEERKWACRCLGLVAEEMKNVVVLTDDEGNFKLSKNGAKMFDKAGPDDFHDGARNAYIAFRCWLRSQAGMGEGLTMGEAGMVSW